MSIALNVEQLKTEMKYEIPTYDNLDNNNDSSHPTYRDVMVFAKKYKCVICENAYLHLFVCRVSVTAITTHTLKLRKI